MIFLFGTGENKKKTFQLQEKKTMFAILEVVALKDRWPPQRLEQSLHVLEGEVQWDHLVEMLARFRP